MGSTLSFPCSLAETSTVATLARNLVCEMLFCFLLFSAHGLFVERASRGAGSAPGNGHVDAGDAPHTSTGHVDWDELYDVETPDGAAASAGLKKRSTKSLSVSPDGFPQPYFAVDVDEEKKNSSSPPPSNLNAPRAKKIGNAGWTKLKMDEIEILSRFAGNERTNRVIPPGRSATRSSWQHLQFQSH